MPTTFPLDSTCNAASTVIEPLPHPISNTVWPADNLALLIWIDLIYSFVIGTYSVL